MNKLKQLLQRYRELITYVIFGVLTTAVNLVVFKLCNMAMGSENYLISNVIAWIAAVIFAYITNKLYVFESRSWKAEVIVREMISFFAARVASFLIEEAGLFLLVDVLAFRDLTLDLAVLALSGEMLAKLILAVIVVVLNYVFSKLYIFKKKA